MEILSIEESIASIDSFKPNKEQLEAINSRDYIKATSVGVTFDQYMALVSPKYRAKLASLIY